MTPSKRDVIYRVFSSSTLEYQQSGATSTVALSDCTSHILSNCSTRAPGWTNHWMTWHSVIPTEGQSQHTEQNVARTFSNVCQKIRLHDLCSGGSVEEAGGVLARDAGVLKRVRRFNRGASEVAGVPRNKTSHFPGRQQRGVKERYKEGSGSFIGELGLQAKADVKRSHAGMRGGHGPTREFHAC